MAEQQTVTDGQPSAAQKVLGVCAIVALFVLAGVALAVKDHNPALSSTCFLVVLFVSLGIASASLTAKLQAFLDQRGYRPQMPYVDSAPYGGDASWGSGVDVGSCGGDGGGGWDG